jgi:hypothetical protein
LLIGKSPFDGRNVMAKLAAQKDGATPSLLAARLDVPE